jgi:hypothetical protein
VKALLALLLGGFGLGAWWWRRTRHDRPELSGSPAEELRAKLAETRAAGDDAAPPEEAAPAPGGDPDARRRDVHERARQKLDELN